jgi:hypothetical protein
MPDPKSLPELEGIPKSPDIPPGSPKPGFLLKKY